MNLMEAFKALDKLNEDVFTVDTDGIKKLQDFVQNDDTVDELDVFNLDAEPDTVIDENECHVGDAILDCCICHSKIFKPVAEVVVDEESQVANKGEECPYCYSVEGYKVAGEVKPAEEVAEAEEAGLEEDIDEVNISTDDVEIEIEDKEDSEDEAEEIEIGEETEEVTETIDLAAKDNTVAGILRQHMDELSSIFDPNELRNKVIEIVDSSNIADKPVADRLKRALFSKKSVGALLSTIGTYMTGDKVIKTGKYRKSIKESTRIPSEYSKYFMIDDYEPDDGEYKVGDKVDGVEILAYTVPKEKYEDIIDEWPFLLKDRSGKVFLGSIIKDRIYPFELSDYIDESKRNKLRESEESIRQLARKYKLKLTQDDIKYADENGEDDFEGEVKYIYDSLTSAYGNDLISWKCDPDGVGFIVTLRSSRTPKKVEVVDRRVYEESFKRNDLREARRNKLRKSIKESAVKIPTPFNKYLTVDRYEPDEDEYQIGEKIHDQFEVVAYLKPKARYEDVIDEWPILFKDSTGKVFPGTIVRDRIYPFELSDYIDESNGKYFKESEGEETKEETIGDKLKKYQMWVDYDMEHYGKVSETTQKIIDEAGLQLIKDQYGDYEVSVGSYKAESFVGKSVEKQCEHRLKEDINSIRINSDDLSIEIDEPCEECSEEQVVAPVDEETRAQIEFDVDEDAIEDAVEECLTESFSNVKFFKCSNLTSRKNRIIVEGILGFKSGKKKNTSFVFRPSLKTESTVKFRGYNKELKESVKSITLNCKKTGKKVIAESLKVKK